MPAALSRQARRITLYLFEDDCQNLESRYGRGWTEQVRLMVEKNCKEWHRHKAALEVYCAHGVHRKFCSKCNGGQDANRD